MSVEIGIGAAVVLALAGVGYAAWTWLRRRLRDCETRLDACEERRRRDDRPAG